MDGPDYIAAVRIAPRLSYIGVISADLRRLIAGYYPRMYSFSRVNGMLEIIRLGMHGNDAALVCLLLQPEHRELLHADREAADNEAGWWQRLYNCDFDLAQSVIYDLCLRTHGCEYTNAVLDIQ